VRELPLRNGDLVLTSVGGLNQSQYFPTVDNVTELQHVRAQPRLPSGGACMDNVDRLTESGM
jgi:hypothetical protein